MKGKERLCCRYTNDILEGIEIVMKYQKRSNQPRTIVMKILNYKDNIKYKKRKTLKEH